VTTSGWSPPIVVVQDLGLRLKGRAAEAAGALKKPSLMISFAPSSREPFGAKTPAGSAGQAMLKEDLNTGTFSSHENLLGVRGGAVYARGGRGGAPKILARSQRSRSVVPTPRHFQCRGADNKTERFLMGWCV
jgi:hypothetical protein